MVALTADVAARLLGQQCSTDVGTHRALLVSLRRWRAEEEISDELYDDLNAVLDPYPRPAGAEAMRLAQRLREAAGQLPEAVSYLAKPYPVAEMRRLVDLSAQRPGSDDVPGYVVRLALAVLSVLDVMGDAAP